MPNKIRHNERFVLKKGCVQLWFYDTRQEIERERVLTAYLNAEEHEQAAQFRFEKHRQRFIVGRGVVREILAQYVGVNPESLEFSRNEFGKPYIAQPTFAQRIKFNVSNSHYLGVTAITLDDELGVDLEQIRPMKDYALIVEGQFPEEEKQALFAKQESERLENFYGLWTSKEAYLKGKGLGLNGELKMFVMTDVLNAPRLLWSKIDKNDTNVWSFYRPEVVAGFSCCVAVNRVECNVQCETWPI